MNKRYISAAVFIIAVTAAVTDAAFGQEVMTVESCRAMALENNRAVAIAGLNADKAGYTRNAYRANYFPKVTASANYLYSSASIRQGISPAYLPTFTPAQDGSLTPNIVTAPDGSPVTGPDGSPVFKEYAYFPGMDMSLKMDGLIVAGVSVEQPIYTGGKITAAFRMASIGGSIAGLGRELTRAGVIVKADEAYYTYTMASETVGLARSYLAALSELLRNVEAAVETGLRHRNDALKVRVKVGEAELQLRRAENGAGLARKNLCHVTGLPLDSEVIIPATAGDGEGEEAMPQNTGSYDNRPEYAMLEKQVELKDEEIRLVRSDFLPRGGLVANYGYANGLTLNGSKALDRASFSVLATVSVPVFQWGEGRNKVRAARAERAAAILQRDEAAEQMTLEISAAYDRCSESAIEVKMTAANLEQAAANVEISRQQYTAGMEPLSAYLEAQTTYHQAQITHLTAKTRQKLNQTHYQKATSTL
ncbi:MAG: TolC family protein [Tannerellaceae bacterium]|jgi:outer membrane protein TolC|nr:TolC family protein [Tannerellaceae bacterium]